MTFIQNHFKAILKEWENHPGFTRGEEVGLQWFRVRKNPGTETTMTVEVCHQDSDPQNLMQISLWKETPIGAVLEDEGITTNGETANEILKEAITQSGRGASIEEMKQILKQRDQANEKAES